ncbi:MAG: hypothetical protein ACRDPL_00140 [Propionibacteriaceae bacterium]
MRRLISITALAAVAVMAFVPAASAATKTVVTFDGAFLTNGASMWSGQVVSPKTKCAHKRVVLIFKQRPGKDQKIGSAKAERVTGVVGYHWAFEKVGFAVKSSEKYYAKVTATEKCAGARSPVLNAVSY